MAEFEKDFMMHQVKDMAKVLSKFMSKDDVNSLLEIDEQQSDKNKSLVDHKELLDLKIGKELEKFSKEEREENSKYKFEELEE